MPAASKPQRGRPRIHGERTIAAARCRRPDPASPEERAADEVRITSARADGRPRQACKPGAMHFLTRGRSGALVLGLAAAAAVAVPASASASTGRCVPGGRARLRQRQHRGNQHDRGVRPARRRLADPRGRVPVRRRRRRDRRRAGLAGRAPDHAGRPVPDRRRRRQQPDLGAADHARRLAPPGTRRRRSPPAASCRSASPSTATWCTWPTPAPAAATTPASGSRPNGRLIPIPGSTVALPADAAPGDVLFNGTGTKLVGTEVGTSLIDSFTVGSDGRLTAAPGSPFPAQGLGPFGSEFRPTNPGPAVRVQRPQRRRHSAPSRRSPTPPNGTLTPIGGLPVRRPADRPVLGGDHPRRPVPVHRQHRIRHDLPLPDRPRRRADPARQHPGRDTGGVGAVDARLSPDGRFLYVDESRIGAVGAFAVTRRQPDRTGQLPVPAARRRHARRHRRQLVLRQADRSRGQAPAAPVGPRSHITCGPLHRHTPDRGNRSAVVLPEPGSGMPPARPSPAIGPS